MRYPLAYDPQYWAVVFPLAMYTVCTYQLARVPGLGLFGFIPRITIFAAGAAWIIGFVGLVHSLVVGYIRNQQMGVPISPVAEAAR